MQLVGSAVVRRDGTVRHAALVAADVGEGDSGQRVLLGRGPELGRGRVPEMPRVGRALAEAGGSQALKVHRLSIHGLRFNQTHCWSLGLDYLKEKEKEIEIENTENKSS